MQIEVLDAEGRGEVLSTYLDGELSPSAARHVTTWLEEHPDQLRQVEHDRRIWDLLGLYEEEPVPQGFAGRVLTALGVSSRAADGGRVLVLRPRAFAAAAVLLMALGAFLFWSLSGMVVGSGTDETGRVTAQAPEEVLEGVPVDYLGDVDLLIALSDDGFQGYLLADVEDTGEDG